MQETPAKVGTPAIVAGVAAYAVGFAFVIAVEWTLLKVRAGGAPIPAEFWENAPLIGSTSFLPVMLAVAAAYHKHAEAQARQARRTGALAAAGVVAFVAILGSSVVRLVAADALSSSVTTYWIVATVPLLAGIATAGSLFPAMLRLTEAAPDAGPAPSTGAPPP